MVQLTVEIAQPRIVLARSGSKKGYGMTQLSDIPDTVLIQVCRKFVEREGAQKIARWLAKEHEIVISRERVYALVGLAAEKDYFSVQASPNDQLAQRISDCYSQHGRIVRVANTVGASAREYVCRDAAKALVEMIKELGEIKKCVHLGLGGGHTVRLVSRELAVLLRSEIELPKLALHVISSGFSIGMPRTAPIMFLGFFDRVPTEIDYYGLFAPAVVKTTEYKAVKGWVGVEESFAAAKDIDIVITSVASAHDDHGALTQFAEAHQKRGFRISALKAAHWAADLQYNPYAPDGPIDIDVGVRSMTLFELPQLKELASQPNKHVVVVAPPCGGCDRLKSDALMPLLQNDNLAVWTHLFVDVATAQDLLPAAAA